MNVSNYQSLNHIEKAKVKAIEELLKQELKDQLIFKDLLFVSVSSYEHTESIFYTFAIIVKGFEYPNSITYDLNTNTYQISTHNRVVRNLNI